MSVVALLVSLVYQTNAGGFTTPRWALLACAAPFLWYFRPSVWTPAHALGAAFLGYCALSLLWTFNLGDGALQFGKFALLAMLFCAGAGTKDLKWMWVAAGFAAAVNSGLVMGQHFFEWGIVPQAVPPAATFFNKNIASETAALVAVGLLSIPRWRWLALVTVPTLVLCEAKGVLVGLSVAAILLIWNYNRLAAIGFSAASAGALWFGWGWTMTQRMQIWQDAVAGMSFAGRGIGSFWATFPEHATRIDPLALRPMNAHNDLLQMLYEVGPATFALIGILWFAFRQSWRAEHYVLIVFLVEGLVGFPLYMPATAFFAAVALGYLCGLRGDVCRPRTGSELVALYHARRDKHAAAFARSTKPGAVGSCRQSLRSAVLRYYAAIRRS